MQYIRDCIIFYEYKNVHRIYEKTFLILTKMQYFVQNFLTFLKKNFIDKYICNITLIIHLIKITEELQRKIGGLDFVERVFLHVDYQCDGKLDGNI